MTEENRFAVGTMVLAGRDHVVLIRGLERLLAVTFLDYAAQVKPPSAFDDEVPDTKVSSHELKLARTLVEESTPDKFDFAAYKDDYSTKVSELVDAKISGKKIVAHGKGEEPHITNLMDALQRGDGHVNGTTAEHVNGNGKSHGTRTKTKPGGARRIQRTKK
jgi:DNA end-binding protein Ku